MKSHQFPFIEVPGEMIEMLKVPISRSVETHGVLSYKKLSKQRSESNRSLSKNETYVEVTKKWLFGLLEVHFAQASGIILGDVRKRITI